MWDFTSWPLCLSVEGSLPHSLGSELGSDMCHTILLHCSMLASRKQAHLNTVSPISIDLSDSSCAGTSEAEAADSRFLALSKRCVLTSVSNSRGGITSPRPRTKVQSQICWLPSSQRSCRPRSRCFYPVVCGGRE